MTSCLSGLSNSTWLPVDTIGWLLGDHGRHGLYMIGSPAWWDHQLALPGMHVGWMTLAVSEGSPAFGEPLSLQHVWFSQGTENNVSAIRGAKRACKWERRDLLDASSADKPGNCADCQSEEWKGRSKRGNSASNLIHLFHRKAHKVTHRPSIPVSWLGVLSVIHSPEKGWCPIYVHGDRMLQKNDSNAKFRSDDCLLMPPAPGSSYISSHLPSYNSVSWPSFVGFYLLIALGCIPFSHLNATS